MVITSVKNFFLYRYKDAAPLERRKAWYLFYITLSASAFISIIAAGQFYFNSDLLYKAAYLTALTGVLISLVLFRERKIQAAGHLVACSTMVTIILETCVHDFFSRDPAIRYSMYVSLVSLMGVSFLVISFFRDKKYILIYSAAFLVILLSHAAIIFHSIGNTPEMRVLIWQHLVTVILGMIALGGISTWLLSYMEAMVQQNLEYARHVVTQKNMLEKIVAERTQDLQTSNQHLSEFAYIVSHDLKEPLRTISGFVTLIKKELARMDLTDSEIADYIRFVNTGTVQMEKLIKDILAYSKLNVVEKEFREVNVDGVLKEVKSTLTNSIHESGAKIFVTGSHPVKGQKLLLEQLFQNLISNAIKYRSPERPLIITIGCRENKDEISYFVQDNGIGIAPQYFDTIFKAFKRLHSKVTYEGTGVGLAICKKIADIHGSHIWVESTEGEGSTFWFTMPAADNVFAANQAVFQAG